MNFNSADILFCAAIREKASIRKEKFLRWLVVDDKQTRFNALSMLPGAIAIKLHESEITAIFYSAGVLKFMAKYQRFLKEALAFLNVALIKDL